MCVVFSASGDTKSYHHSSSLIVPLLRWLLPGWSPEQIENLHYIFRKCAHMTEYAILAWMFWRAIRHSQAMPPRGWRWDESGLAWSLVFLYAASDELHQVFVPNRTGLVSDVAVDVSGAAIGLTLLWISGKIFKRW